MPSGAHQTIAICEQTVNAVLSVWKTARISRMECRRRRQYNEKWKRKKRKRLTEAKLFAFCTDIECPHRGSTNDAAHRLVKLTSNLCTGNPSASSLLGCDMYQDQLITSTLLSFSFPFFFCSPVSNCTSPGSRSGKETLNRLLNFLIGVYAARKPSAFFWSSETAEEMKKKRKKT